MGPCARWGVTVRRVEGWLFAAGSAERLAALRMGLCTVLAIRLSRGIYLELAGQPEALFRPVSFTRLLAAMPPREVVLAVQVAGVAAAVLGAVGLASRFTLPAAWAAALFLNGLHTSVGKIMHNDVLLLLAMVPLLPAPAADAWSLDALQRRRRGGGRGGSSPSGRYGWPVRTAMVVVAGAYLFAGLAKVVNSGPAWVASDSMRWILYASSDSQPAPNAVALFVADRAWVAHAVAAATLGFELTFPVVLWRRRAAWLYVPGAVALHAGIWLTMRLDYTAWMATVLVVFADWPRLAGWLRRTAPAGARSGTSGDAATRLA